jgi:hypothetical protein
MSNSESNFSESRRTVLKSLAAAGALTTLPSTLARADLPDKARVSNWHRTHDRVFLGENFWANPMEDWRVVDGAAECQTTGGMRNIQLLTHQITDAGKSFRMAVSVTQVEVRKVDGGAGFKVGVKADINEHRANCFAKNGIPAGIIGDSLVLGRKKKKLAAGSVKSFALTLTGEPADGGFALTLTASQKGKSLGSVTLNVPAEAVLGNVALVSNFDGMIKKGRGARYRFANWAVDGDAFTVSPEQKFGPILWSMYTLSDSRGDDGFQLTLSALSPPLGEKDNKTVELLVKINGEWKSLGKEKLDPDAWVATFRVSNWDEKTETSFRLVYVESHSDGTSTEADWTGKIKANPTGRPLRLGALTCQNDYAFPYEPVANNLVKLDPDMLYFSGDQLYEGHGGFGLIRDPAGPAILNYLRKYYQHGWSFREAMRDRPTVCLADDHDVFQGNIWGEDGAKMTSGSTSSKGGYREPAAMVNVVHKTNCGHHPPYFDPTPCQQNISVYYGDLVYGGVSFAILGDRQFKSGPTRVDTGSGRADHVLDPKFDTSVLDKPGLNLLGERQEKFLAHWAKDWRGHSIKVLLSQTVFAGVATHHGGYNGYLKADLDSGGWPQTARNNAIRIIRPAMPLHINGDQHLTTLTQYGVDKQRDGFWSFCTPAIAAGYPRWWRPDEMKMGHENRPKHGLANTGEFLDGFGNKAYVYAVGNPEAASKRNRYEKAHQKGSGFGLVTIDTGKKTYYLESFRFLVDPTDGKESNQFPGWPVTIQQKENDGANVLG